MRSELSPTHTVTLRDKQMGYYDSRKSGAYKNPSVDIFKTPGIMRPTTQQKFEIEDRIGKDYDMRVVYREVMGKKRGGVCNGEKYWKR